MEWRDLFRIVGKEEQERRTKEYEDRIFHLGAPDHKKKVSEILAEASTGEKADPAMLLYAFIIGKDSYLYSAPGVNGDGAALLAIKRTLSKNSQLHPFVLALIRIDSRVASLEDYPTIDEIISEAEKIKI